jgi:hypothetical protein
MKAPIGYVVYEGPSRINGEPIVAIATGFRGSQNPKTGLMLQLYIMNASMAPLDAVRCGANTSVCGNCPMKKHMVGKTMVGACYVNLGQGPTSMWKSYKAGLYPKLTTYEVFRGRMVRLGAYGDPTAIPLDIIKQITEQAAGWTGYTHHWQAAKNQGYKKYCVASCDSLNLAAKAQAMGWDSFRHKAEDAPLEANEMMCPADPLKGVQCINCKLCTGCSKKNIVIDRHGPTASHFKEAA